MVILLVWGDTSLVVLICISLIISDIEQLFINHLIFRGCTVIKLYRENWKDVKFPHYGVGQCFFMKQQGQNVHSIHLISYFFPQPFKCVKQIFFLRSHDVHKQKTGKVCATGHSLATSGRQPQMISIGFQMQRPASSTTLPDTARDKTRWTETKRAKHK